MKSKYEFSTDGLILWIKDLNGDKSLTNDMENVLNEISFYGINIFSYKIMYQDSQGIWDEVLVIRNEKRTDYHCTFRSIGETDYDKAKEKLLNR